MRLREALELVPDHRSSQGRRHSLGAILSLAVCAMLCGARSLYAIAQWGRDHGAPGGEPLGESPGGEPLGESSWGSALARRPVLPPFTVATYHRVFKDLDVDAFEAVLGEWLINSGSGPGETLSLDGKTLGGIHGEGIPGVQLVSAYGARSGAVLTQVAAPGKGQELAAAKAVLDQAPLAGRVVVADALLTQREVCWQMVDGGGDYRLPVKERQPTLYRDLAEAFSPTGS